MLFFLGPIAVTSRVLMIRVSSPKLTNDAITVWTTKASILLHELPANAKKDIRLLFVVPDVDFTKDFKRQTIRACQRKRRKWLRNSRNIYTGYDVGTSSSSVTKTSAMPHLYSCFG
jgi:hypothetical protein